MPSHGTYRWHTNTTLPKTRRSVSFVNTLCRWVVEVFLSTSKGPVDPAQRGWRKLTNRYATHRRG